MSDIAPKLKRIVRFKKATILKVDSQNENNYISMRRSLVRVESDGVVVRLDRLTQRHYCKDLWYGEVVPDNEEEKINEVVVYLEPEKIYFT